MTDVEPPHYRVFLEADGSGGGGSDTVGTKASSALLDSALCAESAVYAAWRAKHAINECEVVVLPEGRFEALRSARLAEGTSPQQLKVSRVLREPRHQALLRGCDHSC